LAVEVEGAVCQLEVADVGVADAFGDVDGAGVADADEGDDVGGVKVVEAVGQGGVGGFGCVALCPVFSGEAPADF
jgi:hypothetical protein